MISIGELIIEAIGSGFRRITRPKKMAFATSNEFEIRNYLFYQFCDSDVYIPDDLQSIKPFFTDPDYIDITKLRAFAEDCVSTRDFIKEEISYRFYKQGSIEKGLTLRRIKNEVESIAEKHYSWLNSRNRELLAGYCRDIII